nr:UDP-2,3-diacylglucosamine diphosphatase [uncultured Undibacterium sp.]
MSALSNNKHTDQKAQPKAVALFVSDVHLSDSLPHTTEAFLQFLKTQAIHAERLYLLGDLFEYWAGDDDSETPYNHSIIAALRSVSDAGVRLYWMAGNRDFLVGEEFAHQTAAQLLDDPHELQLAGRHLLISHGDALCTDDVSYMAFRSMVRAPAWQQQFLSKPLSERKAIIQGMRQASNSEQKSKSMAIMDVNQHAVTQLCQQYPSASLIHGHTHRTAMHSEAHGLRYVLPDWDCDHAAKPRGGYLRLEVDGKLHFIYL